MTYEELEELLLDQPEMIYRGEIIYFIYKYKIAKNSIKIYHSVVDNAIGVTCSICDNPTGKLFSCIGYSDGIGRFLFIIEEHCMKEFRALFPQYWSKEK